MTKNPVLTKPRKIIQLRAFDSPMQEPGRVFMKNSAKISTVMLSCLLAGFAQTSHAAATVSLPTPDFHTSNYHFFIKPSISYGTIDTPDFSYGVIGLPGTQNAMTFKTGAYSAMPGIALGFNFDNNFLPLIFGPHATVEVKYNYLNTTRTTNLASTPSAFYWAIDGSGNIVPFIIPLYQQTLTATNTTFKAENTLNTGGIFFEGHTNAGGYGNVQFTNDPSIGFIYHNLKQTNNLSTTVTDITNLSNPLQLNENINTDYYGAQIGNTISFQCNPHFAPFIKGSVALIHANSSLNASEVLLPIPSFPVVALSVIDNKEKWSYEADIGAGMKIYPFEFPFEITVEGGADYLGFVPGIANPTTNTSNTLAITSSTAAVHLTSNSALNPYVTLTFTLPF
jgi:hypothetical protein